MVKEITAPVSIIEGQDFIQLKSGPLYKSGKP